MKRADTVVSSAVGCILSPLRGRLSAAPHLEVPGGYIAGGKPALPLSVFAVRGKKVPVTFAQE